MMIKTMVPAVIFGFLPLIGFGAEELSPTATEIVMQPAAATETLDTDKNLSGPSINCAQPSYDFGVADEGSKAAHTFKITNEGDTSLVISRVKSTCGCTVATLTKKTLAPQEEASIKVVFDLSNRSGHQSKTIRVISNDPKKPQYGLTIQGQSIREVEWQPRTVFMQRIDGKKVHSRDIILTGRTRPVNVDKLDVIGAHFSGTFVEDPEKKTVRVTITTDGKMKEGRSSGTISLRVDGGKRVIRIPVHATVAGPLVVTPPRLVLSKSYGGKKIRRMITLRPGAVKKFQITRVEVPETSGIRATIQRHGGGSSKVVLDNLDVNLLQAGDEFIIHTDTPKRPVIKIPVIIK